MALREDILETFKLALHELEGTAAWDVMSLELRAKIRTGIIKLEATETLEPTADELAMRHLDELLLSEFESLDWMYTSRIIETTRELGRHHLAEEMESKLKAEGHAI